MQLGVRQTWEPHCDNYASNPWRVASWYSDDLQRMRVGYWMDSGVAKLFGRRLPSGTWIPIEVRQWSWLKDGFKLSPKKASVLARAWLKRAMKEHFPKKAGMADRVTNEVRLKRDGRLVTVRM